LILSYFIIYFIILADFPRYSNDRFANVVKRAGKDALNFLPEIANVIEDPTAMIYIALGAARTPHGADAMEVEG
jgi:hypothetical protein